MKDVATVPPAVLAEVKRFLERWVADPAFRDAAGREPRAAAARLGLGLGLDPDAIRSLWDPEAPGSPPGDPASPLVQAYRDFIAGKLAFREQVRAESASADPRVETWRQRQLARCALAFDPLKFRAIVHPPAAIELSRGCSVGCWFCGVSAPRLTDHFRYTEATARLWRDVLDVLGEVWGDGARWSFLYWATDPLDNPDYEHFLADFHDRFGVCPQTTTALPLRDVARTRALLRYARAHGCRYDRFSMLSLRMLERTHAAFGAEELLAVELTPLNPESGLAKANAGRYRDRWLRGEVAERPAGAIPGGATIACVSGFLLNMVDRVVKLVSPCNADDRWPLGYIVFAEAGFADGRDLRRVLGRMVAEAMRDAVGRDDSLRFRPDLRYERTADGIRLTQDTAGHRRALGFRSPGEWDLAPLGEIADLVATGGLTAGEIAARLWERAAVPPAETLAALNHLLPFGIFDEPPGRAPSPPGVLGSRRASTGPGPEVRRAPSGGSGLGPGPSEDSGTSLVERPRR